MIMIKHITLTLLVKLMPTGISMSGFISLLLSKSKSGLNEIFAPGLKGYFCLLSPLYLRDDYSNLMVKNELKLLKFLNALSTTRCIINWGYYQTDGMCKKQTSPNVYFSYFREI